MTNNASAKWPPAAAGIAALALVFLVLPNPLNVPQNNPTASAEYAPVPGKSDEATNANFGQTNVADSAGIGSGGEGEGLAPGAPPPPPPPRVVPRQVQCIGNPPRQTEDPLSPPCVPYFEGHNGGKTFTGVTRDEVKVVLYNDSDVEGDLTDPWKPSDEKTCTYAYECEYLVRTIKAQLGFFQKRYQTYGRKVVLIGKSASQASPTCADRQSDASATVAEHKPFAAVTFGEGAMYCFNDGMAKRRTPTFGINFDVPRSKYEKYAPYSFGFMPDQESQAQWSAGFICTKLRGRPARFAGSPELRDLNRKFGLVLPNGNGSRGPEMQDNAALLLKNLKSQCGLTEGEEMIVKRYDYSSSAGAGAAEAGPFMNQFKTEDVTTVVCYCVPVPTEETVPTMQNAANGINYRPEWYWDHASAMDRPIWQQTHGSPSQPSFGVSYLWRAPAFKEQYHYQAYLQEEPGTQPNVRFNFTIYHLLLNLFQAIQAAGPQLTPESVERGMFTFNYQNTKDPWVPSGGYGRYGSKAVGTYTFVDTAMGWWYDPTGTPPGGKRGEGCIRPIRQGQRFYWDEWPEGDSDLFKEEDPCTQDTRKLVEPGASTSI